MPDHVHGIQARSCLAVVFIAPIAWLLACAFTL
jgi:hypothetical protein